jgi:hypothetical protein
MDSLAITTKTQRSAQEERVLLERALMRMDLPDHSLHAADKTLRPRHANLPKTPHTFHQPMAPAQAATAISAEVSSQVMTYLQAGQTTLAKVKELLDLGPANQLYAMAASQGEALLIRDLSVQAREQAIQKQMERLGLIQEISTDMATVFLASHPLTHQVERVSHSVDIDPQLLKMPVAARTGLCMEYAALTALLLMQEAELAHQPFEILVCSLADPSVDALLSGDKRIGKPHCATLLRPPGTADTDHANTVVLDGWQQEAPARLLSDTDYPKDRPFRTDMPFVHIIKNKAEDWPRVSVQSDHTLHRHDVALEELATFDDYRAVHGSLQLQDFKEFIKQNRHQPTLQASANEWECIAAGVSQSFFQPAEEIAQSTQLLELYELYQQVNNAAENAPSLYRSRSGNRLFEPTAVTFPSPAATRLSPAAHANAQQHVLRVATTRPAPQ